MRAVIGGLRDVRAALAGPVPLAACCTCLEDVPASSGVLCKATAPAARHFICHGCLRGHVSASIEPLALAANMGRVPCPAVAAACAALPWEMRDLRTHVDVETAIAHSESSAGGAAAPPAAPVRPLAGRLVVSTIAGGGARGFGDGTRAAARFDCPWAISPLHNGSIVVVDADNNCIRLIAAGTGAVSTLAGRAGAAGFADGCLLYTSPSPRD